MCGVFISHTDRRWKEAEQLEMRKTKLETDHSHTLTSMSNLAAIYRGQGRWEAVEELDVQAMEMSKKKLRADHLDTPKSMDNLAHTWNRQGREEEAVELMSKCVEQRTRKIGVDHLHLLSSKQTLNEWQLSQIDTS